MRKREDDLGPFLQFLRAIEKQIKRSGEEEMPSKKVFASGEIVWLPIAKLNVDHSYQRRPVPKWAKHIADNFDPDLFGVIWVNRRKDGTYWVIDGQQRITAVRDYLGWGDDQLVPCMLVQRDGAANEAKDFTGINTERRGVRPNDAFFARIVAKETTAVNVKNIIEELGLQVSRSGGDGCVAALKACEYVYWGARSGPRGGAFPWLLRDALRCIVEAWGHERVGLSAPIIKAMGQILRLVPDIEKIRLVTAMSKYPGGPTGLIADSRSKSRMDRVSSPAALADLIVSYYNKGLRTNKIPLWRDVVNSRCGSE